MSAQNLSARDVARALGVDVSSVRKWRAGRGRATPERARALGALLGVALDCSEARPSAALRVLERLADIALGVGYVASFKRMAAP